MICAALEMLLTRSSSKTAEDEEKLFVILLCGAFLGICLLTLAALQCANQIKIRRKWKSAMKIKNGLIVSIGIGKYGPRPQNAEFPGFCANLPVQADVENLRTLSEFLYFPFLTMKGKLSWTRDEVFEFLETEITAKFFDDKGEPRHDGLIVAISSHGVGNNIISSEYELINRTEIHRCISEKHPQIREIPRIFLFDACDGTRDRKATLKIQQIGSDSDNGPVAVEALKPGSGVMEALEVETEWTSKTKNPDYNMVVVHGANDGFVSKMQENEVGSYLTYFFAKAVRMRIERKERKGLSELLTDVQNVLHDAGKQLIRKEFFNNTEYLRIERRAQKYNPPTLELIESK